MLLLLPSNNLFSLCLSPCLNLSTIVSTVAFVKWTASSPTSSGRTFQLGPFSFNDSMSSERKTLHSIENIDGNQGILKGKYNCTVDLLFDCFGISCITTDNFCLYLQNRPIQISQTGGQQYSDTSPFSIPWWQHLARLESSPFYCLLKEVKLTKDASLCPARFCQLESDGRLLTNISCNFQKFVWTCPLDHSNLDRSVVINLFVTVNHEHPSLILTTYQIYN
jgi:hypothetical protein